MSYTRAKRTNVKKLITFTLIALALAGGSFCVGGYYGQETFEPQVRVVTKTKTETLLQTKIEYVDRIVNHYIEKPVEVPVEIPVEVPVEVEVVKVQEAPIQLRQFDSVEALKAWLEGDKTDSKIYAVGSIDLNKKYDCEDYGIALVRNARKAGYDIHFQFIKAYQRPDTGERIRDHVVCLTIIGNGIYLIEPTTDEVWLAAYLD